MRVEVPDGLSVDDLAPLVNDAAFPVHKPFSQVTGVFNVEQSSVSTQATQQITGHVWNTADERQIVQARRDGFLYAERAPYQDWEAFLGEAEPLWLRYREVANPTRLLRIGCRFVNRVDIPLQRVELTEYLLVTPEVPPGLPQEISSYLLHVDVPRVRPGVDCRIISSLLPPPDTNTNSLVLDIDVWSDDHIETQSASFDEEVRRVLAELRIAKNDVFEACITDKCRRLFL